MSREGKRWGKMGQEPQTQRGTLCSPCRDAAAVELLFAIPTRQSGEVWMYGGGILA